MTDVTEQGKLAYTHMRPPSLRQLYLEARTTCCVWFCPSTTPGSCRRLISLLETNCYASLLLWSPNLFPIEKKTHSRVFGLIAILSSEDVIDRTSCSNWNALGWIHFFPPLPSGRSPQIPHFLSTEIVCSATGKSSDIFRVAVQIIYWVCFVLIKKIDHAAITSFTMCEMLTLNQLCKKKIPRLANLIAISTSVDHTRSIWSCDHNIGDSSFRSDTKTFLFFLGIGIGCWWNSFWSRTCFRLAIARPRRRFIDF